MKGRILYFITVAAIIMVCAGMARAQLGKTLSDDDVRELVAFLKSLTGETPKQTMPRLPDTAGRTLIH